MHDGTYLVEHCFNISRLGFYFSMQENANRPALIGDAT
jgi:hypothetical protein